MKIRKNALMFLMILFAITFILVNSNEVSAKAIKFNKTSKTITKGKSYTIKISGLKLKRVKKVTLKYNKKVIKVKRIKKNTYRVVGKKKGKTTLKARVKYRTLDDSIRSKNIKCRITVKNKKKKTVSRKDKKTDTDVDKNQNPKQDVDWREDNIDRFLGQIEKSDTYRGAAYKLNDYTIYRECDSYQYGFITSPYWSLVYWYNEKEYKELLAEMQRIVEVTHIKDDMIDEEKAYRLGRYLAKNIDYYGPSEEHTAYGTLFNKKTVCAGYSTTFAILCRYVGIECDYVQTDEIGNHAWNLIKLGDYWYVVDITHAAVGRNSRSITYSFFREYDYLSSNCKEHLDKDYWTDEYIVTHPIDTKSHYMRCKLEERMDQTLSGDELYNLPE